jgi:hypothetical protein
MEKLLDPQESTGTAAKFNGNESPNREWFATNPCE